MRPCWAESRTDCKWQQNANPAQTEYRGDGGETRGGSSGTGKFEGTKGKGTYKGERLGSPQTGGDSYVDAIGTQWK